MYNRHHCHLKQKNSTDFCTVRKAREPIYPWRNDYWKWTISINMKQVLDRSKLFCCKKICLLPSLIQNFPSCFLALIIHRRERKSWFNFRMDFLIIHMLYYLKQEAAYVYKYSVCILRITPHTNKFCKRHFLKHQEWATGCSSNNCCWTKTAIIKILSAFHCSRLYEWQ